MSNTNKQYDSDVLRDLIKGERPPSTKVATSSQQAEKVVYSLGKKSTDKEIDYPEGYQPFSKVFGFKPPSGVDHAVRVFEDDYFSEELKPHIPNTDPGYKFPKAETEMFVVGYMMGDNIFLHGPTGSGKSSLPKEVAARMRMPWIRVQGRIDLDSSSVVGTITVEDGTMGWSDGPLPMIWREGGIYQQDEWTITPAAMNAVFQRTLERDGDLYLEDKPNCPTSECLVPKNKFACLVATDNTEGQGDTSGRYAGTGVQNSATMDRFSTNIKLDYMSRTEEIQMLKGRVPSINKDIAEDMLKFAQIVRSAFEKDEINTTLSPRVLVEWARKAEYWDNPMLALKTVWFDRLTEEDRATANTFIKKVFNTQF